MEIGRACNQISVLKWKDMRCFSRFFMLFAAFLACGTLAFAEGDVNAVGATRPKVALVLCGGGAKGAKRHRSARPATLQSKGGVPAYSPRPEDGAPASAEPGGSRLGGLARLRQRRAEMRAKAQEEAARKAEADAVAAVEREERAEREAEEKRQRAEREAREAEERAQQREALRQIQEQLRKEREAREAAERQSEQSQEE